MSLQKLNQAISNLSKINLVEIVQSAIVVNKTTVVSLNTDNQLYKGIDALGQSIEPSYAPITKKIKARKGQPTDRVTLKDTGSFYSKFQLKASKFPFEITSSDSKKASLEKKYGENIFGLTDDSKDKLILKIAPDVINEFKKQIEQSLLPLR